MNDPADRVHVPFSTWLRDQASRQDEVGDLASVFVLGADLGLHDAEFDTPKLFKQQLVEVDGGHVWRDAFRAAKAEYGGGRFT